MLRIFKRGFTPTISKSSAENAFTNDLYKTLYEGTNIIINLKTTVFLNKYQAGIIEPVDLSTVCFLG